MRCFSCQATLDLAAGERVGFRDACPRCDRDLHACRNCGLYDPGAYNECRESSAERVLDKERGNRCDYFRPGASGPASDGPEVGRQRALGDLEALFKKP